MAASFEALDDFLDDYLELPVPGLDGETRVYRIADPSAEDGIKVERITTLATRLVAGGEPGNTEMLDDNEEIDLYQLCLGDTYDELRRDLSWSRFKHVALTAMWWIVADRETAEKWWKSGGDPEALAAPNRAARRQQSDGSSGSAAASTTRSRGSTSGTRAASQGRRRGRPAGR